MRENVRVLLDCLRVCGCFWGGMCLNVGVSGWWVGENMGIFVW